MTGVRRFQICVLAFWFAAASFVSAGAAPSEPPDVFIKTLSQEAISSLTRNSISSEEREKRFRDLFTKNFDIPGIGQFVLGLHWRRATPEQRREFLALFEDFIVKSYAKQFGEYSGDEFRTNQIIRVSDTDTLVSSQLRPSADKQVVRVDWRVRASDSSYKIVDVVVEGISMSVTHRDEFAAVIRSSGGTVDGLITALRKKTQ
jgi:phospholipid transport system substrate-binding protein